jgi:hypothetical protein
MSVRMELQTTPRHPWPRDGLNPTLRGTEKGEATDLELGRNVMSREGRFGVAVKAGIALAVLAAAVFPLMLSSTAAAQVGPQCRGLAATIVGTSGPDNLVGTAGRDVIVARAGNDDIQGRGGNDVVCAGRGADDVLAGRGRDRVFGGDGVDEFAGGAGNDRLSGQVGADQLAGNRGADLLLGGRGFDRGSGGRGIDTCRSVEIAVSC